MSRAARDRLSELPAGAGEECRRRRRHDSHPQELVLDSTRRADADCGPEVCRRCQRFSTSISRAFSSRSNACTNPSLHDRPIVIGGQPTAWGLRGRGIGRGTGKGVQSGPQPLHRGDAVSRRRLSRRRRRPLSRGLGGGGRDPAGSHRAGAPSSPTVLGSAPVPVEWAAIDSVFLDLSGTTPRIGPARAVAERVQRGSRGAWLRDVRVASPAAGLRHSLPRRLSRPRGLLYVLPDTSRACCHHSI